MFEIESDATKGDLPGHPAPELDLETARTVQRILIQLAHDQEDAAAREAAQTPYWKPCPDSVRGSRAAARALRAIADSLALPSHFDQPSFSR
ncbi:MAG: hypothetical protein ACTHOG_10940 [Marmoricola sp.]